MEKWRSEYIIRPGGLMRCCLMTLDTYMMQEATEPPKEGDKLSCRYHGGEGMIYKDGGWEWNCPTAF